MTERPLSDLASHGSPRPRSLPFPLHTEDDVLATVRLLVAAGADVNAVNADGNTALHPTASAGLVRVIRLLADHGARLDVKNKNDRSPLDLATPRVDPRSPPGLGSKAAEDLLRRLLATGV